MLPMSFCLTKCDAFLAENAKTPIAKTLPSHWYKLYNLSYVIIAIRLEIFSVDIYNTCI